MNSTSKAWKTPRPARARYISPHIFSYPGQGSEAAMLWRRIDYTEALLAEWMKTTPVPASTAFTKRGLRGGSWRCVKSTMKALKRRARAWRASRRGYDRDVHEKPPGLLGDVFW